MTSKYDFDILDTMKIKILIPLILLAWINICSAQSVPIGTNESSTNIMADLKNDVKQQVATNINEVMVEILSGVKAGSGEIYNFSKHELWRSI